MQAISKKILIVEDDKFLSRALNDKLTRSGFSTAVVYNGDEALAYLERERERESRSDLARFGHAAQKWF